MGPLVVVGVAALLAILASSGGAREAKATLLGLPTPPSPAPKHPPPPPNPPPRPTGLTFDTRNLQAVDALVGALIADPNLTGATLNIYASQFELYGFESEADALRKKAAVAPKYTQQEIQSGVSQLWEKQAKQGFW